MALSDPASLFALAKGQDKTEARIKKPKDGKLASGEVQIEGTATCPDFSHYTLSFAPEGDPDNWTTIGEYSEPVGKGLLGTWNTSSLPDGPYLLGLTVFSTSGPAAEDQVQVGVDNNAPELSISSPDDNGVVVSPFEVTGTVTDAYLHHWKLFAEPLSPLLLAHLDGNTVNERDGEEGILTGEPFYQEAKFAQGLHVDVGEGLTYPAKNNIDNSRGTIEMWVVPDWEEGDTASHILLQTETGDAENPTDCIRVSADEGALTFTVYDSEGDPLSSSVPLLDAGISQGVPFHLGATWSQGNITLAVNGFSSPEPQGDGTGIISSMGKHIHIGFYPGLGQEAKATVDELAVYGYDRPLTSIRTDCLSGDPKQMGGEKTLISEGKEPVQDSSLGTVETDVSPGEAINLTITARDRAKRESETTSTVFADNLSPYAEITCPGEGEKICGKGQDVIIKGTAFDMDLASYTLAFKQGNEPNAPGEWTGICTSSDHIWRDLLGTWSLAGVPDGEYTIRLEVTDRSGKTGVAYRTVLVYAPPFAEITSPEDGQAVTSPFEVRGTARSAIIDHWTLSCREKSPLLLCHFDGNTENERDGGEGEITGSPSSVQGKFDQGLLIRPNDSLSYPTEGNIAAEAGTVQMWVTPEWSGSDPAGHMLFVTEPPDPEEEENFIGIVYVNGTIMGVIFDQSGEEVVVSYPVNDETLPAGVPFHLAFTWSEGDIRLYVNGVESTPQGDQPGTGVLSEVGARIYVGSFTEPGIGADAVIDELSIHDYSRIRTAIAEDYLASLPRPFCPGSSEVASGNTGVEDGTLGTVQTPSLPGEGIELELCVTDLTGEVATGSVNLIVDAPSPTAEISYPGEGQLIYGEIGVVDVVGTATDIDFESYRLLYKQGGPEGPEPWNPIETSPEVVLKGTLGSWDTTSLSSGYYTLMLEVTDRSGKTGVAYRTVLVYLPPFAEITSPEDGQAVTSPFEVRGTARSAIIDHWTLSCREMTPLLLCHFDGNTENERDGDTGEITGSPTFTDGRFGGGLLIGTDDCLSYPTEGNIAAEAGTVQMWVTPQWSGSDPGVHMLFATEPANNANSMWLFKYDDMLNLYVSDSSGLSTIVSYPVNDETLPAGVPFHLAFTWSEGDIRLYVNGVESTPQGDQPGTGVLSQMGQHIYVGSFFQPGMGAQAVIDELSIHDYSRIATAVAEDYLASLPRPYQPGSSEVASGNTQVEDSLLGTVQAPSLPGEGIELELRVTDLTGEVSTDSMNLIVDAPSPTAEISYPGQGQRVYGEIDVVGTATDIDFESYRLLCKQGGPEGPEPWNQIGEPSPEIVLGGTLGTWSLAGVPDGEYTLRLEVTDAGGKTGVADRTVLVYAPPFGEITSPQEGQVVTSPFEVRGTARSALIDRWTLIYRERTPSLLCHFDGNTENERDGGEGEITGSPIFTEGKFGQGLLIGADDSLSYPTEGNIAVEAGTVQVWVTPEWSGSDPEGHMLFVTDPPDPGEPGNLIAVMHMNSTIMGILLDQNGEEVVVSYPVEDETLPAGVPFHLAFTWSEGDVCLYVNGVESTPQGDQPGTGVLSQMGQHIYVGSFFQPGMGAQAVIDELSIHDYSRIRTAVAEDYLASSPRPFEPGYREVVSGNTGVEDGTLGTVQAPSLPGEGIELELCVTDLTGDTASVSVNLIVDAPSPTAEISYPGEGQLIHGEIDVVDVEGTATDIDFESYRLLYKEGGPESPEPWNPIEPSPEIVLGGTLGSWDATSLSSGYYTLRLEVTDRSGKTGVAHRTVLLYAPPFAEVTSPEDGQVVTSPFEVHGTARSAIIDHWTLIYRERTPSLLCHFDGNTENERDGDTGEITGSPTFTEGKFGQGLLIGTDDSLSYPTEENIAAEAGTVQMWVTPQWSGSDPGMHMLFATEPVSNANSILLFKYDDMLNLYVSDSSGLSTTISYPVNDETLPAGVPFHLAFTWSDGDIRLYVNGVESTPQGDQPGTGVLSDVGARIYVGSFTVPGIGVDAVIDELSIHDYGRIRTAIAEDYLASLPRPFCPGSSEVASGNTGVEDGTLGIVQAPTLPGEGIELELCVTDLTGEVASGSVNLIVDAPSPTAEISYPGEGQLIYGEIDVVDVEGTATDIDFESYRLLCKQGGPEGPEPWNTIETSLEIVLKGTLGTWDTTPLTDGEYTLRLEVTDRSGKVGVAHRTFEVNSDVPTALITFPLGSYGVPGTCPVTGSARGSNFTGYKVEYKEGHHPSGEWFLIGEEHTEPVQDGLLETWDTTSLPEDPFLLRLTVSGLPGMDVVSEVPVYVDHTEPVALITAPPPSALLTGLAMVEGTANDDNFSSYLLEYASHESPGEWHTVTGPNGEAVQDGLLSWWNTEELPDGTYTLRLTATDTAGHQSCCFLTVETSNPPYTLIGGISIQPTGACLAIGETRRFICVARDTEGHSHSIQPSWSATGGVGTIDAYGQFTATALGCGTVGATYESFTCTVPVSVVTRVPSTVLTEDTTWGPAENPWVVDGWVVVPEGITLTLEPGTVVKFSRGGLYVEGTLLSSSEEGSEEILLTSFSDDTVICDTNANGPSEGSPGDWSAVYFSPVASSVPMEGTSVLWAGAETDEEIIGGRQVTSSAAIRTWQENPTFTSCTVAESSTNGVEAFGSGITLQESTIRDVSGCGLQAMGYTGAGAGVFTGNTISDCGSGIVTYGLESLLFEENEASDLEVGLFACDGVGVTSSLAARGNYFTTCDLGMIVDIRTAPGGMEISGNTFTDCAHIAEGTMVLEETEATTRIFGNTFTCTEGGGLCALMVSLGTNDTRVYDNHISGYTVGIQAGSYGNLTVENNTLEYADPETASIGIMIGNNMELAEPVPGERMTCSGNTVEGFTVGIVIDYDDDYYFSDTTIRGNTLAGPGHASGIYAKYDGGDGVFRDTTLRVEGNNISEHTVACLTTDFNTVEVTGNSVTTCPNPDGVAMGFSMGHPGGDGDVPGEKVTFTDNTVQGPGYSVSATNYTDAQCTGNTITCEQVDQYGCGAFLGGAHAGGDEGSCLVEGNNLTGKRMGMMVGIFNTSTIRNNTMKNISVCGLECISCTSLGVAYNTISGSGTYGISANNCSGTITRNVIWGFDEGINSVDCDDLEIVENDFPDAGAGGMKYSVLAYDKSPVGWDSRAVSGCNYVMERKCESGIHVSSFYVEQYTRGRPELRHNMEIGWVWWYTMDWEDPQFFWAITIEGQYFGGLQTGLLGVAPKGTDHQYEIYMAYPCDEPWTGYRWYFLIDGTLRAELQTQISMGTTKCSSERNSYYGPSNYSHFWYLFSMTETLGDWRPWGDLDKYYDCDMFYDLNKISNTECFMELEY